MKLDSDIGSYEIHRNRENMQELSDTGRYIKEEFRILLPDVDIQYIGSSQKYRDHAQ